MPTMGLTRAVSYASHKGWDGPVRGPDGAHDSSNCVDVVVQHDVACPIRRDGCLEAEH